MSIILNNIKTHCFKDINLELKDNEKIAILGENGIGKTTLLRTILGLVDFEGQIDILQKSMKEEKDFNSIYSELAYLFQDSDDSFLTSSVLEEIAFNFYNKTENYDLSIKKALELLEEFNILHLKEKIPIKLSGGQKRVVAFCACILSNPKILLLDEPLNHLDEKMKKRVEEKILLYKGSVVLIAHDFEFAKRVCTKIYKLEKDGLILLKGEDEKI